MRYNSKQMVQYSELQLGNWYYIEPINLTGPHNLADKVEKVVILESAPIETGSKEWSMVIGYLASSGGLVVWKSFEIEELTSLTGEQSSIDDLISMLMELNSRMSHDWAEILRESQPKMKK